MSVVDEIYEKTIKDLLNKIRILEDILDEYQSNSTKMLETNRKLLDRVKQLEGFIKTIVDENPTIFCCYECIPNAPNAPRHIVEVFGLGLENECQCKEEIE